MEGAGQSLLLVRPAFVGRLSANADRPANVCPGSSGCLRGRYSLIQPLAGLSVFTRSCGDSKDGLRRGYVSFPLVIDGVFDFSGSVGEAVQGNVVTAPAEVSFGWGGDSFPHLALPATGAGSTPADHLFIGDHLVVRHHLVPLVLASHPLDEHPFA